MSLQPSHQSSPAAPPPRRPRRANTAWWWALLGWGMCVGSTVGALLLLPGWNRTPWSADVLAPPLRQLLMPGVAILWLVVTWRIARSTRRPVLATAITLFVGVSTFVGWASSHVFTTRWRVLNRCIAADGAEYAAVLTGDGFDSDVEVCVVTRSGPLIESVALANMMALYTPRRDVVIVPSRISTADAMFVAPLDGGDVALLVRGETDGTAHVDEVTGATPSDRRRRMLPFVLFGPEDEGTAEALAFWRERIRDPDEIPVDLDTHLMQCLDHPSPWVRDAARDLVRTGGPVTFWRATRALEAQTGE